MEQTKKHSFWEIFFSIFVAAQLLVIFAFNLFHLKYVVGFDSSAAMAQAMEIWKQKTLFLKHWFYQSTLGLDSMIIPASLLYGITKNIFLSYGIADCLGIILFLAIFYDTLKTIGVGRLYRLITYVLILTPYSLEPLGYMPMMFTNASYYIIKVLIPVMLIDILIKMHKEIPVKKYIPLLVLYGISIVLTAFSSGIYLLICGLFPIMLFEMYMLICSNALKNIKSRQFVLIAVSIVLYAFGYVGSQIYGEDVFTNNMILCQVNNFADNFFKWIVGLGELFGAVPSRDITITSFFGIHYLSHMGALFIYLIILFVTLKKLNPFKAYFLNQVNDEKTLAAGMVSTIFFINALVLILTDTTYGSDSYEFRYHLIPVVAGFLIIAVGMELFIEFLKLHGKDLIKNIIFSVIAVIWFLSNVVFVYYFNNTNIYNFSKELSRAARTQTDNSILYFVCEDTNLLEVARIARLLPENKEVKVVDCYGIGDYFCWGASSSGYWLDDYDDDITVICEEEIFNDIDEDTRKDMEYVATYEGYNIYHWKR